MCFLELLYIFTTPATFFGLRFLNINILTSAFTLGPRFAFCLLCLKYFPKDFIGKMASEKKCCVPQCNVTRDDEITMHCFPNPDLEPERFRTWLYRIGGDVLALENRYIFKRRRVCHNHFEPQYRTWTKTLTRNAVPSLLLPGSCTRSILSDISNIRCTDRVVPHEEIIASTSNLVPEKLSHVTKVKTTTLKKSVSLKKETTALKAIIKKLRKQKDKYATRLKKALRLSENETFQKGLKKFTRLAALFTILQFREISKDKMGRRFTKEEKIMALSLYKQGPRAYRWLSKIFVLPSPVTLSRLISKVGIKPGINKNIFSQLKKRVRTMSKDEKLCMVLFDEIKLTPHFDYNRKKDIINGFVNDGYSTKKTIADHALVFMLRGVIKNYKQPIAYTFCRGTTSSEDLKTILKNVIIEIQSCGLTVLATVCDQGSTNVSAINKLISDTRQSYLRENKVLKHSAFTINGQEIFPLFDPPHLIKGIRNNLITKNLKCTIDGCVKIAKWDHIIQLYHENPAYKGIRLIKNLTDLHVDPKKMPKMKVKYATQVFSKTVGTNMGYLADKGILARECQDTADVILFFDDLFDSVNGSYYKSNVKSGKHLLGPVTPKSEHSQIWIHAKTILRTMRFITKDGSEDSVPSIKNWIVTLENMENLKNMLFTVYNFKSLWMRHFNQDPLENFFGCIRSHGWRNNSPTPAGFETAFVSLLVSNITSFHSKGSNCEEDFCKAFGAMDNLFNKGDQEALQQCEIDFEDLNCELTDFNEKKTNVKIIAELCYVTGYILRQAKIHVFKNCKQCKKDLYGTRNPNDYLIKREYFNYKQCLTYPAEPLIKYFSELQDIITQIIEHRSETPEIKNYCKTIISIITTFDFMTCEKHKFKLVEFISDISCRFFICNWCRDVNKILNGTRTEHHVTDYVKTLANDYYITKNKKK